MTARAVVLRVGAALVQVAVAAIAVFVLTALLPGDTAVVVLGEHADQQQLAALRAQLGLDDPLEQRFLNWVTGLLRGDLGVSLLTGAPVAEEIGRGLATTVLLAGATLLVLLPVAFATGVYCGLREDSRVAWAVNSLLLLLNAIPEFVLGLLLIGAVSVRAGWLPATAAGLSGWSLLSEPAVLVLPVLVLAAKQVCGLARQVRIGVIEANSAEYADHVRLLGLSEPVVVLRHVLPGGIRPALQQLARTVDGLLGGVVVVEALFAFPGVGSGFVEAVKARDLPLVQGYALLFAVTTVVLSLVADLLTARLVPQAEAAR